MAIILFFSAFILFFGVIILYFKKIIQKNSIISILYILGCFFALSAGWIFPTKIEVISDSYLIGFNNKIALFFLVLIICITIFLFVMKYKNNLSDLMYFNTDYLDNIPNKKKINTILYRFVLFSIIIQICWFFVLDKNIEIARIGDNWNYIPKLYQMDKGFIPYKDFEFTYGYLMLFIPFLFMKILNLNPEISYIIFLIIGTTIGIYSLFIILIKFLKIKNLIFWAICINSIVLINSLLYTAIHYTFFRFITPLLLVFLLIKYCFKLIRLINYFNLILFTLLTYCVLFFNFEISPEIGITTCLSYILTLLFFLKGRKVYYHILFLFLFFIITIFIFKIYNPQLLKNLFIHFIQVSSGAWNLPWYFGLIIISFFYILFINIQYFSYIIIKKKENNYIYIFCTFIFSFFNLPSALGRADFGHIFFNGIGFFLISIMTLNYLKNKFVVNFIKISVLLYLISFVLVLNILALPSHRYNLRKNIIDNFNIKLKKNHISLNKPLELNSIVYLKELNKKVLVAGYLDQSLFKIYKENDFLQFPYFVNMNPKTNMNIQKQLNEIKKYEYMIILKKNFDSLNNNNLIDKGINGDLLYFLFLSPCFEKKLFKPTIIYNLNHKIFDFIHNNYLKIASFNDSNYYLLRINPTLKIIP